jgi:hypothetical protein
MGQPRAIFRGRTYMITRRRLERRFFLRPDSDMAHDDWIALLRERIAQVEQAAALERRKTGAYVLGRRGVLRQHWNDSPRSHELRRRLSPRVAAKNKWARIEALLRNRAFLVAYRIARAAFLEGLNVLFPAGTYWLRRFAGVTCEVPDARTNVATSEAPP